MFLLVPDACTVYVHATDVYKKSGLAMPLYEKKPTSSHFTEPNTKAGVGLLAIVPIDARENGGANFAFGSVRWLLVGFSDLYKLIKGMASPDYLYTSVVHACC